MNISSCVRNTFHILGLIGGVVIGCLIVIGSRTLFRITSQSVQMLVVFPLALIGVGVIINNVSTLVGYLTGNSFRLFSTKPRID